MRRLFSVASILTAVLLVLTLCQPAQAKPRDPETLPAMSASQAKAALQRARSLFAERGKARRTAPAGVAPGRAATLVLRDLWRAEPSLRGADRTAARRMLARPSDPNGDTVFGMQFVLPPASTSIACTQDDPNAVPPRVGHFCIHYATTGPNASTAEHVQNVADVLEYVRDKFVNKMGFRAPIGDTPPVATSSNPNGKFDVFLGNLGPKVYGYCTRDSGRATSYCALDNNFTEFSGHPLNSLAVTAAHEFFHAVQFAYDADEDLWLMEGSSVWAEDQAFPKINDYLQYVWGDSVITRPGIPVDQDSVHNLRVYSAMLFFQHMTQTLGVNRMREVWEAAQGPTYSLQAVRKVVSRFTNWGGFINRFGVWNSRPPGIGYADRKFYPQGRYVTTRKLGLHTKRKMSTKFRRSHLASGAVRLKVSRKSTRKQRVRIKINGPTVSRGAVAAVQIRRPHKRTTWHRVKLNRKGNATIKQPFGRGRVSSIVITVANASTWMNDCGGYALPVSYSCGGHGVYRGMWKIRAKVIR